MPLRDTRFPADAWLRTCQECNHVQAAKNPSHYKGDSWRDMKCRKCKSESLDYGTENEYEDFDE